MVQTVDGGQREKLNQAVEICLRELEKDPVF
jgi:hypothetical protein